MEWRDFSDNGNHGLTYYPDISSAPVLVSGAMNGRDAVTMRGDSIEFGDIIQSGGVGEAFIVLKKAAAGPTSIGSLLGGRHDVGSVPFEFTDNTANIYANVGRIRQDLTQPSLYSIELSESARTFRLNGVPFATWGGGASLDRTYDDSSNLYGNFSGSLAEVIVFNRSLSDTDRSNLYQYLHNRYALVPAPLLPESIEISYPLSGGVRLDWKLPSLKEQLVDVARKGPGDTD
jgi:hypothetical protein